MGEITPADEGYLGSCETCQAEIWLDPCPECSEGAFAEHEFDCGFCAGAGWVHMCDCAFEPGNLA